ncbi:DedA family protein [Roseovarius sp. PS-C2]|uniref:DedA family protein n=1 Tax=Roseovarius sp. PS-C2 TaxID=2820814 RepID=UPI001C0D9D3F|nr:DedA family protein [Roseovarius sp. PS-C2]MBU3258524.1 DedA family protein [Roseovarius sp. PS-C2]
MTTTEALIENYGLLAVFAGSLLEGETIVVLAALAAHHGILSLPSVFFVAACAATIGDQIWFALGRFGSERKIVKRMVARSMVQHSLTKVHQHPTTFVLSFRFIYGLRIAGALACGLSRMPLPVFVILNIIAALLWTAAILALGYSFGSAIEAFFGQAKQIEWKLMAAIVAFAVVFTIGHLLSKRKKK